MGVIVLALVVNLNVLQKGDITEGFTIKLNSSQKFCALVTSDFYYYMSSELKKKTEKAQES